MTNIILIGMPGAGKSTVGVILAKALKKTFIDTDIVIQEDSGRLLQEIIDTEGPRAFLEIEERTILSRHFANAVIATGGISKKKGSGCSFSDHYNQTCADHYEYNSQYCNPRNQET